MKKHLVAVLCAALAFSAVTACGTAAPAAQPAEVTEEAEATSEEASGEEEAEADTEVYTSDRGWSMTYDPAKFAVNEGEDMTSFVYQGESAGTNMLMVSYISDKQPEEALYEVTEPWGDPENIRRSEGIFPGTSDKWGYWRTLEYTEEGSGLMQSAIAGEYNGGVLLYEITAHLSGDDAIDIPATDELSELLNSVKYENFEPQTMYDYIPGKYVQEGGDYSVTLNEDHTGVISLDKDIDVLWGSIELTAADGSGAREYTIEGDSLMLNNDGEWLTFIKEGAESSDTYAGTWAEKSAERIVLQIDPTDEEGWYDIEITWREDLPQKDVYDMRAHLQDDGSLYYDNCRYVIRTFEGDDFTDDVQYESGSGLLNYDADAQELYWTDYEVDKQENVTTFIKAAFTEDVPKSEQTGTAGSNIPLKDNLEEAKAQIVTALEAKLKEVYGDQIDDMKITLDKVYSAEDEKAFDPVASMNLGMNEVAFEATIELHPAKDADVNMLMIPNGEFDEKSGWVTGIGRLGVLRPNPESEDPKYVITDFGTGW